VHCAGCTVRNTVEHTYETGLSMIRVPATLTVDQGTGEETVALFVTTEKIGDRVLLQIETAA
jgi:hypothetical protein